MKKTFRELSLKTNFSSRKIKEEYELFKRHFPAGCIERDDIEEAILTVLPENYCHTIRCKSPLYEWMLFASAAAAH